MSEAKEDPAAHKEPGHKAERTKHKSGGTGLIVAAMVLSPLLTWVAMEFVLVPRLQKKLSAPATEEAAEAEPKAGGHGGKEAGGKVVQADNVYDFTNVVVNLSGTMGTRYLKTSFMVTGVKDVDVRKAFEAARGRVTDVTLNVLSSLTLADIEEPGSKNVIREKLVMAYNQAIGKKVAEQVYFLDFVVQ